MNIYHLYAVGPTYPAVIPTTGDGVCLMFEAGGDVRVFFPSLSDFERFRAELGNIRGVVEETGGTKATTEQSA